MPKSKDGTSKYTKKQERKAEHIEEGYREKGVSKKEAESRAWAVVRILAAPAGRRIRNR